ncbi:hypothetical protein PR048_008535 [Dryococelus australis]|uniref:PiggyBac transposable element-derived protein domain-containing protein n=1 Tax=Dryococelus australis TaxID=614101 RepID=A0ABQ9HY63_9NEOP|nr:hypothetical protein PR048_008535 [Dryococelus australis]
MFPKNRAVLLLSTQHQSFTVPVESNLKRKPEVVLFYNSTKLGVDTLYQVSRYYSVKKGTKRWPLVVFYYLVDLAAVNVYRLFCIALEKTKRRLFLMKLPKEMAKPQVECRLNLPHVLSVDPRREQPSRCSLVCRSSLSNITFSIRRRYHSASTTPRRCQLRRQFRRAVPMTVPRSTRESTRLDVAREQIVAITLQRLLAETTYRGPHYLLVASRSHPCLVKSREPIHTCILAKCCRETNMAADS